jgi:hypothetical protein
VGNDVLAEIVFRMGIVGIPHQLLEQEGGVEHVDAHGTQRHVGVAGHGRGLVRLLGEVDHAPFVIGVHDAEGAGLFHRHLDAGHGHVGLVAHVVGDHLAVVHLVDVVAGQHQHVLRLVDPQDVQVLVDGVGGALVPGFLRDPLLGRQQIHEFVEFAAQETPAALDVLDQRMGLVLGDDADAADARIHAIGQGKVDDAEFPAEGHARLGAPVGQLFQAAAPAAGENQRHGIFGQQADESRIFFLHVQSPSLECGFFDLTLSSDNEIIADIGILNTCARSVPLQ